MTQKQQQQPKQGKTPNSEANPGNREDNSRQSTKVDPRGANQTPQNTPAAKRSDQEDSQSSNAPKRDQKKDDRQQSAPKHRPE